MKQHEVVVVKVLLLIGADAKRMVPAIRESGFQFLNLNEPLKAASETLWCTDAVPAEVDHEVYPNESQTELAEMLRVRLGMDPDEMCSLLALHTAVEIGNDDRETIKIAFVMPNTSYTSLAAEIYHNLLSIYKGQRYWVEEMILLADEKYMTAGKLKRWFMDIRHIGMPETRIVIDPYLSAERLQINVLNERADGSGRRDGWSVLREKDVHF